jgi:hypothetical protein
MPEDAGVNALAPQVRVREMQTKLHRWAVAKSRWPFPLSGMSPVESRMR